MKYECPSCKIRWEDTTEPINLLSHPLCVFCSTRHTQKELLNWQMDHIKDIDPKHFLLVLRFFYRYVENNLKDIQIVLDELKRETNSRRGESSSSEDS